MAYNVSLSGDNSGLQVGVNHGAIEIHGLPGAADTVDDINRLCLRALQCPDSLTVKNQLKEHKDKFLYGSIEWILHDSQYVRWKDDNKVSLIWVKGGAGKGKTMVSIGLIEELLSAQDNSTAVTYFFCQNADYKLNTLESIIKGLIFRLVNQQEELKESLRSRWDTVNNRYEEDITSWRTLWNIFLEMLDRCKFRRVYIIVDALDECTDDGMADFLRLIVRTGLNQPSKIKWLLTSRPFDSAEQELLAGPEQLQINLEINSKQISEAVNFYITSKINELDRRNSYGETLRQEVKVELTKKAEGTYLWVSLVCKQLENKRRDGVLTTIHNLPPDLHTLFDRIFKELNNGEQADVKRCMRLLKVMMLAYRPLNVEEVGTVTGLADEEVVIRRLVDRCASFINIRGTSIEFVHQSARDYLSGKNGQSILDLHEHYGNGDIALSCVSNLSARLQVNLAQLPRLDSTRESMEAGNKALLASINYAATFWVQHLLRAKDTMVVQKALSKHGAVFVFLNTKLLMWLECLSLLNKLSTAFEAFRLLKDAAGLISVSPLSVVVEDAIRLLLRHYATLMNWPLQIYSSALIFSPEKSVVRGRNIKKVPTWLKELPPMEQRWAPVIQTLVGHSAGVNSVVFSPDGKLIVSGADDGAIKFWDATTGHFLKELKDRWCRSVAFSPDGKLIASGAEDGAIRLWDTATSHFRKEIKTDWNCIRSVAFSPDGKLIASGVKDVVLWDAITGDIQRTLTGHTNLVTAVAFSPDGNLVASGSRDSTIKLWDITTGSINKTLTGHTNLVTAVAFSPDGKLIASGARDKTIKIWLTATGALQKTIEGHLNRVNAVAFSQDGKLIASASEDMSIKLWDAVTGEIQKTLKGHSHLDKVHKIGRLSYGVTTVAFSPDGRFIASGSEDQSVMLWDAISDSYETAAIGHSREVKTVVFSPDGRLIASGSDDYTVKLWDARTNDLKRTLTGHSHTITAVQFSPDSKVVASGSVHNAIKIWESATGDLQMTLRPHTGVQCLAFSPNGKLLACASFTDIILYDTMTGDIQNTLKRAGLVTQLSFSPDGSLLASESMCPVALRLWDIGAFQKASRFLGNSISSRIKSGLRQTMYPSFSLSHLKFSADGQYLETEEGTIKVTSIISGDENLRLEPLDGHRLSVKHQWIYCGSMAVLRLPPDYQMSCYETHDETVAIGFQNGRVLSFSIDLGSLRSS